MTQQTPEQWLSLQRSLYSDLPDRQPSSVSIHPVSGTWQDGTEYLRSQFWWGGGASQEAFNQLPRDVPQNQSLAVLTFGPVQAFLGAGQRLRDWAVASWLCHYLAAVTIHRWEEQGGFVLLPLHRSSPLLQWIKDGTYENQEKDPDSFWQAELPNVFTGIVPTNPPQETEAWLENLKKTVIQEWLDLVQAIEDVVVKRERERPKAYLDGPGWKVVHRDHQHLWSVYYAHAPIESENITDLSDRLHLELEGKKLGRKWEGTWWGGRTSPTAGNLSIWHPGLKPIDEGGTWGLPDDQLETWWERIIQHHSGLFGAEERLNSIELIKRLASAPHYMEAALKKLWEHQPPDCPWERFPDQTAVAAAWVPSSEVDRTVWNNKLGDPAEYFGRNGRKSWGIPQIDKTPRYVHPEILERRNLKSWNPTAEDQDLDDLEKEWREWIQPSWTTPIQWTVGWRGDGDNMGKWLSGKQYEKQNLPWKDWHPTSDRIQSYGLNVDPPTPQGVRKLELPHMIDLSVLFGHWNQLLYPLVEEHHAGKVIFAGGDDFLLLGPLPEAVSLTTHLHDLWSGRSSPLTTPLDPSLDPSVEGWVKYEDTVYPIPGQRMTFSLGVVIAQRRIPQSLWHRNLNEAYKAAKSAGRDRVCVRVLFNSNQTLDWICPWKLWDLLMTLEPSQGKETKQKEALNRWEKLLDYMEPVRVKQPDVRTVQNALELLWQSIGLNLTWQQVLDPVRHDRDLQKQTLWDWDWWIAWVSLRGFLARQERDRQHWLKKFSK